MDVPVFWRSRSGYSRAAQVAAQSRPVELGLDAGFSTQLKDPKFSTIGIPLQRLRIGFFASDQVEVEPAIALNWLKPSGDDALTTLNGGVGVLVHFNADAAKARPYVRPFAGLSYASLGGESESRFNAGAGLGVKLPVGTVERFAIRIEGGFTHNFKKDLFPARDEIHLTFGFSFLTK
ncbi:MAG: hypothetical protein ACKVZ0_12025 [Gemmatimonadales bacterium]